MAPFLNCYRECFTAHPVFMCCALCMQLYVLADARFLRPKATPAMPLPSQGSAGNRRESVGVISEDDSGTASGSKGGGPKRKRERLVLDFFLECVHA